MAPSFFALIASKRQFKKINAETKFFFSFPHGFYTIQVTMKGKRGTSHPNSRIVLTFFRKGES
jgi:hypothetical protein